MIIGIYGQIGTGKSTISKYFKKNNFYIINADYIAKKILENHLILKEIKNKFPYVFIGKKLNKNKFKYMIFNDLYNNMKFNILFLPHISFTIEKIINKIKKHILIEGAIINMLSLKFDYLFYLKTKKRKILKRKRNIHQKKEINSIMIIQRYILNNSKPNLILKNNYKFSSKYNYKKMLKFIRI